MKTNVRTFLREFAAIKAKAKRGEPVHVIDRDGDFLFTAVTPKTSLLGCLKGKVAISADADLTTPTLSPEEWRPSL
ncbi:MAG: hypothetical protein ABIO95_04470 [Bdellovibrionota bacterium]